MIQFPFMNSEAKQLDSAVLEPGNIKPMAPIKKRNAFTRLKLSSITNQKHVSCVPLETHVILYMMDGLGVSHVLYDAYKCFSPLSRWVLSIP